MSLSEVSLEHDRLKAKYEAAKAAFAEAERDPLSPKTIRDIRESEALSLKQKLIAKWYERWVLLIKKEHADVDNSAEAIRKKVMEADSYVYSFEAKKAADQDELERQLLVFWEEEKALNARRDAFRASMLEKARLLENERNEAIFHLEKARSLKVVYPNIDCLIKEIQPNCPYLGPMDDRTLRNVSEFIKISETEAFRLDQRVKDLRGF